MSQVRQSLNVEAEHRFQFPPIGVGEFTVIAHAGIVNKEVGQKSPLTQRRDQLLAVGSIGKIRHENRDGNVGKMTPDAIGDIRETLFTPRHEDQFPDPWRKLEGEFLTEARGGPGDEGA